MLNFTQRTFSFLCLCLSITSHADNSENADNLWENLRLSFQLSDQYKRPEVKDQMDWLASHQSYLNQLSTQSQPYMYYVLQEVKKRHMPGEIALLPMIESAYNPLAYSHSGAAGLWQLTANTGSNFGLKQNWWFDGRRDIYNSTNAALNYLSYLHRFFNGNWMLAIAAYHSGEGTVQHALSYNDNHQQSTNFWKLNLPNDTQSYVPKLLALAHYIESRTNSSKPLPYVANTPYFTKIDVGDQIDLTNAARLAGISYPEFVKLNPGNNRWTTSPTGPHTIVLPLDKVDSFVENLKKIPEENRHTALSQHAVASLSHSQTQKQSISSTPSLKPAKKSQVEAKTSSQVAIPSKAHKILHVIQHGDTLWTIAHKYHVSVNDVRAWNHLSSRALLHTGQHLTIWSKTTSTAWMKK